MTPNDKGKAKAFLAKRLKEYERKNIVTKRKRRAVKVIFVICIILSITGGTVCATLVGYLSGSHLYFVHMRSPGHYYFTK